MRKYNYNAVEALLKKKGLLLCDLSRALSISADDMHQYLCEGKRIACQDMIRIDAAIDVLKRITPHRPRVMALAKLMESYELAEELYNDLLRSFDNALKRVTEQEVLHREEQAVDEICFIIGFSNPDITTIRYDPDMDYIRGYSVEEFKKRILERVHLD